MRWKAAVPGEAVRTGLSREAVQSLRYPPGCWDLLIYVGLKNTVLM